MEIALGALIAALIVNGLVTYAVQGYLSSLVASYRTEVQKLTAALISKENPIQAAVYMSHEPEKSTEQIVQDRAESRRHHLPAGLNGL